jgi:hypothetical protein
VLRRRRQIRSLDEHPNLDEVLGVLALLPALDDAALHALALRWENTVLVADARARALTPDSPLILEVLTAFDAVSALYADDLHGQAEYVTLDPATTSLGLKAVRDAIAAAYARPALSRAQHAALIGPWRAVFGATAPAEPDLGPQAGQVKSLLGSLSLLATRCHDPRGQALFDGLAARALSGQSARDDAREAAWHAALVTSRRRLWMLVERSAAEALRRPCGTCRRADEGHDSERVLSLAADAACVLLVADALPTDLVEACTAPLAELLPRQRSAS